MKKLIAWLLSACMTLGMISPAFAANVKPATGAENRAPVLSSANENEPKGFLSQRFQSENTHQFQKDDTVRAIVIMESAPLTDTRYSLASVEAGTYTANLQREKNTVYSAMRAKGVDYELVYTFDTLINGFSCDVAYGDLAAIAKLPGVKSVHIANVYSIPTPQEPNMSSSNESTGMVNVHTNGFKGQGMVVAVLDSGTYLDHEAFQDYGNLDHARLTKADLAKTTTPGQYVSAKIPFAYDYADRDNDPTDDGQGTGGHGTHVGGIAVGYAEDDEGKIIFSGAAPEAQLLAMKIFGSAVSTTSSDVYFKALDDAMKLGADVINMSIGSDSGFTYDSELEGELGNIYEKLEKAGIVVCISNGNAYSMSEYATKGYVSPDYTDYGTAGAPASYAHNIAVGSMENAAYPQFVVKIGGRDSDVIMSYSDSSDDGLWVKTFGRKEIEYVLLTDASGKYGTPNGLCVGDVADYTDAVKAAIEGKIVVISRGTTTFSEKVKAAADAGAIGVVVVNNQDGVINMSVDNYYIPAISVELSHIDALKNAETKSLFTNSTSKVLPSSTAGEMSDFSSWGTTPDLTLRPTLTSMGGNIYSADWQNATGYTLMSGTSMASPNLTGAFASLLSYLYSKNPNMEKTVAAETAKLLMESSAQIIEDPDGHIYSVRQQGAGLARADLAMDSWESGYVTTPIFELGDNDNGSYSFTVKVKNNTAAAITYDTSIVVMTDTTDTAYDDDGKAMYDYVTLQSTHLYDNRKGADTQGLVNVTMPATVNVPANGEATVNVTVALTTAGKQYFEDSGFVNGSFVEGYVMFAAQNADADDAPANAHATFMGYFGDWTKAPVLDSEADFQTYLELDSYLHHTVVDADGNTFADYGYTPEAFLDLATDVNWAYLADTDVNYITYLGQNMLSGLDFGDNFSEVSEGVKYDYYDPAHNMLSTNWQTANYPYLYVNPFQLRNASFMELVVSDANNPETVYYRSNPDTDMFDSSYVPKAVYNTNAQRWASYTHLLWDGTDMNTNRPVADGTKVHVSLNATLPYNDAVQENCWKVLEDYDDEGNPIYRSGFDITMDSTAPVVNSTKFAYGEDPFEDPCTLTVTATDLALAGAYLVLDGAIVDYDFFADPAADSTAVRNEDGTVTQQLVFQIPSWWSMLYSTIEVGVLDYATNETDVTALLVDNVGDPATISLVSPQGTTTIEAKVGDYLTLPECTDATAEGDAAQFVFWCSQYVDEPAASNAEFYQKYGVDSIHFADSEVLVSGDASYYAVYLVGEMTTLEQPLYTAYQRNDYTGDWAIVGQPYAAPAGGGSAGFRYDDPYVLDENGKTQQMKTLDPDVDLSTSDYNEFASAAEGIRFTFAPVEGTPFYTIQNVKTSKYLTANANGEIIMADSADGEAAQWMVAPVDTPRPISLVMSRVMADVDGEEYPQFLVFNDDADPYEFQLMNTSQEFVAGGDVYTPTEIYYTFLYSYSETELRDTVYTSVVEPYRTPVAPSNPGTPTTPDTSTEVKENEDGTTTTIVTDNKTGTVTETTEKADGTVEVVETTKDGAVTETVTAPDGGKTEKVTDTDKNVTITVTSPEGEVLAKVELPAKTPDTDVTFTDVPDGHWAENAINEMAALGIVNGVANDRFGMDSAMTRGMLATVLFRLSNGAEGLDSAFTDVAEGAYYADAVAWAAKVGVVQGISDTEFAPNNSITREQLATMLYRYAKLLGLDTSVDGSALSGFGDQGSIHSWAADAMAWCVANGIITGTNATTLAPGNLATRAQVALMLQRFINLMK